MEKHLQEYMEIQAALDRLHALQYEHWRQHELFTYQWWALLAVLIIPWLIWLRLVDRKRTAIILSFGFFIMFAVIAMDIFGMVYKLWLYPIKLVPLIPHIIPIDWSLLPVVHMLVYQYFPRWKEFIIAEIVAAALLAFVGEPFAEWIGIYHILHWQHIWSFPIYAAKGILGKWIIERLVCR